jgi:hypothetical protein
VVITTKAGVQKKQVTFVYDVRDLLFRAPDFDNAPEFNLNQAVQPSGGGGGGSGGGGSGGGGGGFGGGGGGGGGGCGGGGGGGRLGLLDIFGFERFEINSFEQLLINYSNEALHAHFLRSIFESELRLYKAEGVPWPDVPVGAEELDLSLPML